MIVFSGGGSYGYVFSGVLKYLIEINFDFKDVHTFAGTSIGSLYATLLAIGFSCKDIIDNLNVFNYDKYCNINILTFLENLGLDDMSGIKSYILMLFQTKNIPIDITFISLFEITKKKLIINAVSLYSNNIVFFDYESTPNMPIITAILSSMSLPFIFTPIKYKDDMYIDGGILENLIYTHKDIINYNKKNDIRDDKETINNEKTNIIGFNICQSINWTTAPITNFNIYLRQLISTIYVYRKPSISIDYYKIINIKLFDVNSINFEISDTEKNRLINYGYQYIKDENI